MSATHRFNIETVPLISAFIATDAQGRIRLSADIISLYQFYHGSPVTLGYDPAARAIAIKPSAGGDNDPTAAKMDKRGYLSARRFFAKTRLPLAARRYDFAAEQDGWLIFTASKHED